MNQPQDQPERPDVGGSTGGVDEQCGVPAPFVAPHPGTPRMPRWGTGELNEPPVFRVRNWFALLGPGMVMGAAAIGGGEWLVGPMVTARYGASLLWLAALSIIAQGLYNIEISRYTLYTGEPIFTGKFRTFPGPTFWMVIYLMLDFGSIFPYLAANAATPVAVLLLNGQLPDPDHVSSHWWLIKIMSIAIFLLSMIPLLVGGKIYNSLKALMTFKLVSVVGLLLVLALLYSHGSTWWDICSGFFKFGTIPVERAEDRNGNGVLDPGEDWDGDGHLDIVEPRLPPTIDTNQDGKPDAWAKDAEGRSIRFVDADGDGYRDGENVENVFVSLFTRGQLPLADFQMIALICALAGIAGNGGLTNAPISNFTRDQGWGMGHCVGAIPSIVGGRHITLSHVGSVFQVNRHSWPLWQGWYRHVVRDQMFVWVPACFIGVALPCLLSVEYLRRGTDAGDWNAAVMTAEAVGKQVADPPPDVLASTLGISRICGGQWWGNLFWALTVFCGFLALGPSTPVTIDGIIRRWVDVFWTASGRLRAMDPAFIRHLYFRVLMVYGVFGIVMLWLNKPVMLVKIATLAYNYALGFSCWHTLAVNRILLPRELRPHWFVCIGLLVSGAFFGLLGALATVSTLEELVAGR